MKRYYPTEASLACFKNLSEFEDVGSSFVFRRRAVMTRDNVIILTPDEPFCAGAAWSKIPREIFQGGAFIVTFKFRLTGTEHEEGFAFVMQGRGDDVAGDCGTDLGYEGIGNSLAVEFDTHNNGSHSGDPNNNHISIQSRGCGANSAHHAYSIMCNTEVPTMADGFTHSVIIFIQPLETDPKQFTISVSMDDTFVCGARGPYDNILTEDGVWFGLTGSTGRGSQEHRIMDWSCKCNKKPACSIFYPASSSPITTGKEEVDLSIGLYGSAKWSKGSAILTPDRQGCVGAMWAEIPEEIFHSKSLLLEFDFKLIGSRKEDELGEGFAFVIQGESEDALGGGDKGLGYDGIKNSVAVEFDNCHSGYEFRDPFNDHISIHTRGKDKNTFHHTRASIVCNSSVGLLCTGKRHHVAINILPNKSDSEKFSLAVWMDDVFICGATCPYDFVITSKGVWFGFTASTSCYSGHAQEQRIKNWHCYTVSE